MPVSRTHAAAVQAETSDEPKPVEPSQTTVRAWLFRQLSPRAHAGLSILNRMLLVAILASVAETVIETEPTVSLGREAWFRLAEICFAALFALEYALRLWSIVEDPAFCEPVRGRLRWATTPIAILDLLAWAPGLLIPGVAPVALLRLGRLIRVLRLARLGRFSEAWRLIADAVHARRFELLLTLFVGALMLLISATCLYLAEGQIQPDKFGSIPRALWWAVMTLTTIGYGDVYPATVFGKILAALTAISGIGLIAAPTGILAAAFSDAVQRHRTEQDASGSRRNPSDIGNRT